MDIEESAAGVCLKKEIIVIFCVIYGEPKISFGCFSTL